MADEYLRALSPNRLGSDVPFSEDALRSRVGILQIGTRIAVHRQHLLPVKDVIAETVLREVGILDGPEADDLRDPLALFGLEVGAVVIDHLPRLDHGLVQERLE